MHQRLLVTELAEEAAGAAGYGSLEEERQSGDGGGPEMPVFAVGDRLSTSA